MPRSQPMVLGFNGLIQYKVGLFCSCPAMESSRREHHLNTRGHEIESFGWSRTADAGNFGVDGLSPHRLLLNFEPVSILFMSIHAFVHSSHKFCLVIESWISSLSLYFICRSRLSHFEKVQFGRKLSSAGPFVLGPAGFFFSYTITLTMHIIEQHNTFSLYFLGSVIG